MPKQSSKSSDIIARENIEGKIFFLRGKKIMFDRDLARLYGVETKVLNQAVKRNIKRFPEDFMFQLTNREFTNWKSQIVTSNNDKMGLRKRSYAFTEQGVAMLSTVLNSERAIQVNIQIMRAFTKLRELMISHKDLAHKIEIMERKFKEHDENFKIVFKTIRQLLTPPPAKPKQKIGFHPPPPE